MTEMTSNEAKNLAISSPDMAARARGVLSALAPLGQQPTTKQQQMVLQKLAALHEKMNDKPLHQLAEVAEAAEAVESLDSKKKRQKVARACVRCKQAKTCCDESRPCRRCVRLGVEDQCTDAEQRKPGRKRKNSVNDEDGDHDHDEDDYDSPVHSPKHQAVPATPPPPSYPNVSTPVFLQPAPKLMGLDSTASLPKITLPMEDLSHPTSCMSFDRKHPLYITPDTLPNPDKPYNYIHNSALSALSAAVRAGESFSSSMIPSAPPSMSAMDPPTLPLFNEMCGDPAVLQVLTGMSADAVKARAGLLSLPMHPSVVMQNAYYALFECLRTIRKQFEGGTKPMADSLYRFLCLHFLDKAAAYGITPEVSEMHKRELGVVQGERVKLTTNSEWLRVMTVSCGRAPIGVLGVQFSDSSIEAIFVNDEAARLFGYTPSEIKRLVLDPRENFFLRVWHFEDWRRMFTMSFAAMVQQQERTSTRGKFYHSSGSRFEAIWSSQYKFSPEGVPISHSIFITPIDTA